MPRRISLTTVLVFLVLLSSACSNAEKTIAPALDGTYPVDKQFEKYYDSLGGVDVIGPAISPVLPGGDLLYQYTDAVLMSYDPSQSEENAFHLAPLGMDMGIYDLPAQKQSSSDGLFVDGHNIYPGFKTLLDQLGGIDKIGKPLTELRNNQETGRVEQYFENAGFFYRADDPQKSPRLLSYGAWKCFEGCRYSPPESSRVGLPLRTAASFVKTVRQLGTDFTGFALTEPYIADDGNLEQIYENVVLIANPEHPDEVSLRPISEQLGISGDPLTSQSKDPNLFFYAIKGNKGYNIAKSVMDYIQQHGGIKVVGQPITQPMEKEKNVLQQCFTNVCIEERLDESGALVVNMVSLGEQYRKEFYDSKTANVVPAPSRLSLQLWEKNPMVAANAKQEVGVLVSSNSQPLGGVEPVLIVTLPSGEERTYQLPPTMPDGTSRVSLPPIKANNGTLVPYQVCVPTQDDQKFCVRDSYLIWDTATIERANVQYLPMIFQWLSKRANMLFLPLVQR